MKTGQIKQQFKIQIRYCRMFFLLCILWIMVSCGKKKPQTSFDGNFPYVEAPGFITDQHEAARYVAENYWKRYFETGLQDTAVFSMDDVKFEDAYAGYIQILSLLKERNGSDLQNKAKTARFIATLQSKLFAAADSLYLAGNKKTLLGLLEKSEKYLYDPNSPYLDEEMYIPVLEAILRLKGLDSLNKITYVYQLRLAGLNRVGARANDFEFVYDPDRLKKSSLYQTKAEYLLIYFNNPDCTSCREMKEMLMAEPAVKTLLENGRLKVLSMYIDENTTLWKQEYKDFPKEWLYARDAKGVLRENELYGIRAIPSLYLLDKDKVVLLKDAPLQKVIEHLKVL